MTQIKLTAEQAEALTTATEPTVLCRPDGIVVGGAYKQPKEPLFTPEEIAEAERRLDAPGPWYTTKEVLDHLRSLENQ